MGTKKIIQQAIDLISDESKWITNTFARDAEGLMCNPSDSKAVCWCALGAIQKFCSTESEMNNIMRCLSNYIYDHSYRSITHINDTKGREKVIEFLQEYIKTLE